MSTFSPFPTCCCLLRLIYSPSSCSRRSIQTAPTTGPSREDEWCVFLFCKWVVEFELAMNLALGNAHRCIWWTNTRQTLDKYFQHLPHLLNSRVQGLKRLAGSSTGLAAGVSCRHSSFPSSSSEVCQVLRATRPSSSPSWRPSAPQHAVIPTEGIIPRCNMMQFLKPKMWFDRLLWKHLCAWKSCWLPFSPRLDLCRFSKSLRDLGNRRLVWPLHSQVFHEGHEVVARVSW